MSKKILVVDDSKVSRMFIKQYFEVFAPSWEVIEAQNSNEALALVENQQYDVVSIDYNMPGMNGLALIQEVQARSPKSFIGLLTANVQNSTEKAALELGCKYYKKPVTENVIRQFVMDAECNGV